PYITRPAIANERLTRNRAGDVVLQLKSPYHDGTTHIVMSPLELMQRLAALVPRPRLHLIRFHGVLAPHAKLRPEIIPSSGTKQATSLCLASRACRSTSIPPQPTTPRRPLPWRRCA
ncbi:MAG: transposase, partial [Gammaproteobacteria bacterium]